MTLFDSHHDELDGLIGARRSSVTRAIASLRAALKTFHAAIMTAKMRQIERERMFHSRRRGDGASLQDRDRDAANAPRPPMVLGEKWDF